MTSVQPAPRDVYTHGHSEAVLRSHRSRTAENSAAYLLPYLHAGMSLLDVGCGPGTITADLAARVAPGTVTATDRAAEIVAEAAAVARDAGVTNVETAVADVYQLPYSDGAFDVVHAHQVLQHLTDPVRALGEMRRVCQPGGIVAARDADYGAFHWFPQLPALDRWLEIYLAVARGNDAEPCAGRHLNAWARRAGFADVAVTASMWSFTSPADRAWWGGMWADRIVNSSLTAQAIDGGHADLEELQAISRAWREWADREDAAFFIPHAELICRP